MCVHFNSTPGLHKSCSRIWIPYLKPTNSTCSVAVPEIGGGRDTPHDVLLPSYWHSDLHMISYSVVFVRAFNPVKHILESLRPSVCTHVTTRERLNGFWQNFGIWDIYKKRICSPISLKNEHNSKHSPDVLLAFVPGRVTGWRVCNRGKSSAVHDGQMTYCG